MRVLAFIIALLLIVFAAVQYNDPDGAKWMIIYGVPALLALICAIRPQLYQMMLMRGLLVVGMVAAFVGMVYYWPKTDKWWTQDVWWETETAREGMGMMVTVVALGLIFLAQYRLRNKPVVNPPA